MESVVELALQNSCKTLTNGGAQNGDDFSIDDLLDFSNEDDDALVEDETDLKKSQRKRGLSDDTTLHLTNDFSAVDFPTTELAVPMDDLAELEWLSNFVEDSFTPYSSLAPTKKPVWLTGNRRRSVPPSVKEETCFKAPPPVQVRPKRARTGVTFWSHGSPSSSSSSATSSSSGPPSSPLWLSGSELGFLDEPRVKKQKKTKRIACETQTPRCSHCGVQKTPQWRAGPMGAKTLCNACGVRFKSGRLFPEYRPACSPTFSSELHSNNHRKVIEMRRKKETSQEEGDGDGDGLNQTVQAVPSF